MVKELGFTEIVRAREFLVLFIALITVSTFYSFWIVWYDQATGFQIQDEISRSVLNGNMTVEKETKIIWENYIPLKSNISLVIRENITCKWIPKLIYYEDDEIYYDINIEEVNWQFFYGNDPLSPLYMDRFSMPNLTNECARNLIIPWFTRVVINVRWSYSCNVSAHPKAKLTIVTYAHGRLARYIRARAKIRFPTDIVIPVISFTLAGYAFAWIISKRIKPLSKAFYYLTQLERGHPKSDACLEEALKELAYGTNLLSYGLSVALAPMISLFKIIVRNKITELAYKSKLMSLGWEKPLEKFLENKATKPASTLFELRSVALIIGFLTSVGLTFKWNIGAIRPFIFAFGLTYILCNLGFLAFMVRRSRKDLFTLLFIIFVVVLVTWIPTVIIIFRGL